VGRGFTYLDRIAALHPDLIKVDLRSFSNLFSRRASETMIRGFALFAEQAGASFVVEGVETDDDLRLCLSVGARYVQGLVFAPAGPDFLPEDRFEPFLDEVISSHRKTSIAAHESLLAAIETMRSHLPETPAVRTSEEADELIERLTSNAAGQCLRIYLCDGRGNQLSSNWMRGAAGEWVRDVSYRGSNWSWRPFAVPGTVMTMLDKRGTLSAPYKDLETDNKVRTYSGPLGEDRFIFLDFIDPSS